MKKKVILDVVCGGNNPAHNDKVFMPFLRYAKPLALEQEYPGAGIVTVTNASIKNQW